MRCTRSMAWASADGFHAGSTRITRLAPVTVKPVPPTCMLKPASNASRCLCARPKQTRARAKSKITRIFLLELLQLQIAVLLSQARTRQPNNKPCTNSTGPMRTNVQHDPKLCGVLVCRFTVGLPDVEASVIICSIWLVLSSFPRSITHRLDNGRLDLGFLANAVRSDAQLLELERLLRAAVSVSEGTSSLSCFICWGGCFISGCAA